MDSAASVDRSWRIWAGTHGLDLSVVRAAAHGRRTVDTMRALGFDGRAEHLAAELEAAQSLDLDGVVSAPGAAELLRGLTLTDWAVVTSGTRPLALARLRAAGLPLPAVLVSGDDVEHGKPDPAGYLLAARRIGRRPSDCVVIEDAEAGVRAAKSAGMTAIFLTGTDHRTGGGMVDARVASCAGLSVLRRGDAAEFEIVVADKVPSPDPV